MTRRGGRRGIWESVGRDEPYWGVITHDEYRSCHLSEVARRKFFATGEQYVAWLFETITSRIDKEFHPSSALEFGCGVGRVLIPLANRCRRVVGVDIADSMLSEAHRNCVACGLTNVRLVRCDSTLSGVDGSFDLVHAYIVLQHISPRRGCRVIARLLELLGEQGVAVLHLTYGTPVRHHVRMLRARLGYWCRVPAGIPMRLVARPRGRAGAAVPDREPALLPVHVYDLTRVLGLLQDAGARRVHVEYTCHGGVKGVMLFFRCCPDEAYSV